MSAEAAGRAVRARLRRTSGPGKRLAGEHAAPYEHLPAGRVSVAHIPRLQRLAMRGERMQIAALAGICCGGSVPGASAASGEHPGSLMVVVWPGPPGGGWTQGSAAHKLGFCWWHSQPSPAIASIAEQPLPWTPVTPRTHVA